MTVLERIVLIEEIWAARLALQASRNMDRLAAYESKRDFGRKGDARNAVASRVPQQLTARLASCAIIPMSKGLLNGHINISERP